MPSRSDSGNGDIDISMVKPHKTSGDNRQKLQLQQSSSPKHTCRTMRNPTHTTQLTFDEMTASSINTFNTDDAAALNQERKQKLQEKLRYQQDRFLKRNEGLHLNSNGNGNPASPDSPDHMAISEHSSGVELQEQAQQQEQASPQDSPNRTNRLRTRSIQRDNPKDQWQNAWDEDSDATSDDEERDEHLHHVQRDRLNSDVSKQVDNELTRGEDAVKWESGTENIVDVGYSKPHLEMFSQLRVLGKGSFGKVRLNRIIRTQSAIHIHTIASLS